MKPPKAFIYTAYLLSRKTKQFIGFTEATCAKQAKKRIIVMWRKAIPSLESEIADGLTEIKVYRGRASPNYYRRSKT